MLLSSLTATAAASRGIRILSWIAVTIVLTTWFATISRGQNSGLAYWLEFKSKRDDDAPSRKMRIRKALVVRYRIAINPSDGDLLPFLIWKFYAIKSETITQILYRDVIWFILSERSAQSDLKWERCFYIIACSLMTGKQNENFIWVDNFERIAILIFKEKLISWIVRRFQISRLHVISRHIIQLQYNLGLKIIIIILLMVIKINYIFIQ